MDRLDGKTAVVTGAASGMGAAFCRRFAQAGMNVVLADIEEGALGPVVDEVGGLGVEAMGVPTDTTKPDQVDALASAAIERFGQVNVLCNNAGVAGDQRPTADLTLVDWQWVLAVNLYGVIHGHLSFLPHMIEHGDAHIVNTASIAGLTAGPRAAPYFVSKHGVVALSESLHGELADSTVGVSVLCPGLVNTNILDSDRNRQEEYMPPGGPVPPSEEEAAMTDAIKELFTTAKPPSEVADLVHDAVLSGQFYIYTDGDFADAIVARHRAIEGAEPPPVITAETVLEDNR